MSEDFEIGQGTIEAGNAEKTYDWQTYITLQYKVLPSVNEQDFLAQGEIHERLGYALYRAALQSRSARIFKETCQKAVQNYQDAISSYNKYNPSKGKPRALRCKAMLLFLRYWMEPDASIKKDIISECWRMSRDALKAFDKNTEPAELIKSFNQLSTCVGFVFTMESDLETRKQIIGDAITLGSQSLALISSLKEENELATLYSRLAAFHGCFGRYFLDPIEREKSVAHQSDLWAKTRQISEETAFIELLRSPMIWLIEEWGIGTEKAVSNLEKALGYAIKTGDRFIIGSSNDWLAFTLYWKATNEEDQETAIKLFSAALKHIKRAKSNYSCICHAGIRSNSFGVEIAAADYYYELANRETDKVNRLSYLENAAEIARKGCERLSKSCCAEMLMLAQHSLSRILVSLAKSEINLERKKTLLSEALVHREETIRSTRKFFPIHYFDQAYMVRYLVEIKTVLAELSPDEDTRKHILEEAIDDAENISDLAVKYASFYEKVGSRPAIGATGSFKYELGDLLVRLHEITKEEDTLKKGISSFETAAKVYAKLNMASRVAKCLWKSASCYELLNDHLKSASHFKLAAEGFHQAAEALPQFARFYDDHSLYMKAWSEIEKAKYYHKREDYRIAKRCFERAAKTHRMLEAWRYLTPNYLAWAKVERAEYLSTTDCSLKAIHAFQKASDLFDAAASSIAAELDGIELSDERHMAHVLMRASGTRREYCQARILFEEARKFAKEGDHFSSSEKYLQAASELEKLLPKLDSQQDRNEIAYNINLSYAWQKMAIAEAKASPELYIEASRFFGKASELSSTQTARNLVLGHTHFCRSLEVGTRFVETRNRAMYSEALQHLQRAMNCYQKAKSENLMDHAKATGLLFEAYLRLDEAQTETNPQKKLRLFTAAEIVLQTAAGAYTKNGYLEKREHVLTLMKKLKEDRQLTVSLCAGLGLPVSLDTSFRPPAPTSEIAAGIGKFEHATVEANLAAPVEVALNEQFDICLDLINVADHAALLVRAEEMIPHDFKVVSLSPKMTLTNSQIDMAGRKLQPFKVESIRIRILANQLGSLLVSPRIVYVDDTGTFKECKPRPIRMTVHSELMLKLESDSAKRAFAFLAISFAEDHLKRGMPAESAGWRTLSEIVSAEKLPKNLIYSTDGHRGAAYSELLRSGLIEERVFTGVRGRGGKILKTRVASDKKPVLDYLDREMMKIRTRDAQIIFDFLINCFTEDYLKKRVPAENSGWRTRSEIISQALVTRSSVRKGNGAQGPAVTELRRGGLIEAKIFPNERGRGGRVLKMRIHYEREAIRRHLEKQIATE